MTAMNLHRYPSPSGGFALGKMGVGATLLKQGKTARDYVQNGLVAMWDGIENAGWGVHDASATTWKELVSDTNAGLANNGATFSWGENCLIVSQESSTVSANIMDFILASLNTALNDASGYTVEVVAVKTDNYAISQDQWLDSSNRHPFLFQSYRTNDALTYYTNNNADFVSTSVNTLSPFSASLACEKSVGKIAYLNGSQVASDSKPYTPTFASIRISNRGGAKKRFSIRIYSRALTASEIAANYAIDKERFNLP